MIEIVNVDTGETTPLTSDTFVYMDPVFSPDGSGVAYVSTKPNGFFNESMSPTPGARAPRREERPDAL